MEHLRHEPENNHHPLDLVPSPFFSPTLTPLLFPWVRCFWPLLVESNHAWRTRPRTNPRPHRSGSDKALRL